MAAGFFETNELAPGSLGEITWGLYTDVDNTQWVSRADVEKHQLILVRRVLQQAADAIPYYRDQLQAAQIDPEKVDSWDTFRRLPILTRQAYQENFRQLLATKLPPGRVVIDKPTIDGPMAMPLVGLHTNITRMMGLALLLRDMDWGGLDPKEPIALLRTPVPGDAPKVVDHWQGPLGEVVKTGPLHYLNIEASPQDQLRWLQGIQPRFLVGDAVHLDRIANETPEEGASLSRLQLVQITGHPPAPEVVSRIARAFRAPVRIAYHTPEAGLIASTVPTGGLLHVHAESVIVEVLTKTNRPCGPGKRGRVVLTTLRNEFAPLIRFETGDEATVGPADNPTGRGLPTLSEVFYRKPIVKGPAAKSTKSRKASSKRRSRA